MRRTALAIALITLALPGSGQAPADIQSLDWMAGTWAGAADGVEMEEHWTVPKAASMIGLHRDTAGGKTVSFEFLRIEAAGGALTYWASPMGRPATPFRLVESAGKRAVFENPEKDFPRRILYWMTGDGLLHARVEGTRSGKPFFEEWAWKRAS